MQPFTWLEKIMRGKNKHVFYYLYKRKVTEFHSCSSNIQDTVKRVKFNLSLPLSAQEQTKKSQKCSVMWKSAFCSGLFPCSNCSYCVVMVVEYVFDSSVLFFCLNLKLLLSLQSFSHSSCVSLPCPSFHLPPAPSPWPAYDPSLSFFPTCFVWFCEQTSPMCRASQKGPFCSWKSTEKSHWRSRLTLHLTAQLGAILKDLWQVHVHQELLYCSSSLSWNWKWILFQAEEPYRKQASISAYRRSCFALSDLIFPNSTLAWRFWTRIYTLQAITWRFEPWLNLMSAQTLQTRFCMLLPIFFASYNLMFHFEQITEMNCLCDTCRSSKWTAVLMHTDFAKRFMCALFGCWRFERPTFYSNRGHRMWLLNWFCFSF